MMKVIFGPRGSMLVSAVIAITSLSTLNATILTGSRTNLAFGRDFASFSLLGSWDSKASAPRASLWIQYGITVALILLGALAREGFVTMVEYTAPVCWLFFLLTSLSLFVLRAKEKASDNSPQSFRVPLYPILPLIFTMSCAYMLYA